MVQVSIVAAPPGTRTANECVPSASGPEFVYGDVQSTQDMLSRLHSYGQSTPASLHAENDEMQI